MAALTAPRTYAPAKIQIELPNQPCALAWVDDALVAATYDYVEAEGSRVGGLCLLHNTETAPVVAATLELRGGYALAPRGSQLAVATADGRVALVDVAETLTASTVSEPKGHLFTDVVWDGPDALIVAEGDSGRVSRWRADDGLVESQSWDAHAYAPGCPAEVWCVGRDPSTGLYVSGADDGLLKAWDARAPKPALALRHGAGVTAVLCDDGSVATGSYDESVRLWDLRAPAAPTASLAVGGGAYALARDGDGYLAACMGAGARVLRATPFSVAGVYDHHGYVVYGAVRHEASRRIASCSFYDRGVHVWSDE